MLHLNPLSIEKTLQVALIVQILRQKTSPLCFFVFNRAYSLGSGSIITGFAAIQKSPSLEKGPLMKSSVGTLEQTRRTLRCLLARRMQKLLQKRRIQKIHKSPDKIGICSHGGSHGKTPTRAFL